MRNKIAVCKVDLGRCNRTVLSLAQPGRPYLIGWIIVDYDKLLGEILERALSPLADEVGVDLAADSPEELTPLRDQFSQGTRDFPQLLDLGRHILAERSKDLWALWALVGGVLWSQRFEANASLAATCKLTREFCKRYWKSMYPASIGLRNTLMANIVKWWNTFLVQRGPELDPALLRQCSRELKSLSDFLVRQLGADEEDARRKFPMLPGLAYTGEAMIAVASRPTGVAAPAVSPTPAFQATPPVAEASDPPPAADDWWESDPLAEFGETDSAPAAETVPNSAPAVDPLDAAFAEALRGVQAGQAQASLQAFEKQLEQWPSFAAQFRANVMLGELYMRAGNPQKARRILEFLHHELPHIRLSDWEPELCGRLWRNLVQAIQSGGASDAESIRSQALLNLHRIHANPIVR